MATHDDLPKWLGGANAVVKGLQRLGVSLGTMHVLSVPGRTTGAMRSTPVSPLTVDGHRYIVAGLEHADWARNARAAGWGILRRGRSEERVNLVKMLPTERAAVLREFPRLVPHGVFMFERAYGVAADPEEFAGLAPICPVFRVEKG